MLLCTIVNATEEQTMVGTRLAFWGEPEIKAVPMIIIVTDLWLWFVKVILHASDMFGCTAITSLVPRPPSPLFVYFKQQKLGVEAWE